MSYVSWDAQARPKQQEPEGDWWSIWLVMTGRGWGKTLTGAKTTNKRAKDGRAQNIALVAPTAADARDIMVDELRRNSGILASADPDFVPVYQSSKRRLVYPNGVVATIYSAEDPDQLRGPQHDWFWADELGAWAKSTREETWSNLMFGLRKGLAQGMVTTTPKPILWFKNIIERPSTALTTGTTYENRTNLSDRFYNENIAPYEGTRLGRQELGGELLYDNPSALWSMATIDATRIPLDDLPDLSTIAVSVDPSGDESGHEVGITCGGISIAKNQIGKSLKHGYLLADKSMHGKPDDWAEVVIETYDFYEANYVIVERNFGGAMVKNTIEQVAAAKGHAPIRIVEVYASRGKAVRAEPVSSAYSKNRIHHVGDNFHLLEEQLCNFESGGMNDRVDANVWLWTDLLELQKSSKAVYSW